MFKKYKFGFDYWGLLLFLVIMIPNFIWFGIPAPNDILRSVSVTPIVDGIGSICQAVFVATLCVLKRKDIKAVSVTTFIVSALILVAVYYAGWVLYYCGQTNSIVIVLLTITPCLSFISYAVDRKNWIALIPTVIFTICHIIYGFVNFMF